MVVRLEICIYTDQVPSRQSHSFIIGNDAGGMTDPIATLKVDDTLTLAQLRVKIEVMEDRGMLRRTPLYQEILYTFGDSDGYAFAKVSNEGEPVRIVGNEDETACGSLFEEEEDCFILANMACSHI